LEKPTKLLDGYVELNGFNSMNPLVNGDIVILKEGNYIEPPRGSQPSARGFTKLIYVGLYISKQAQTEQFQKEQKEREQQSQKRQKQ
jgi:hypothetical protein